MEELLYNIALSKIDQLGNTNIKYLTSYCGSAKAIFEESIAGLMKIPGIGETIARNIINADPKSLAEKDVQFIKDNDIKAFHYLDDEYPIRLKRYDDCPVLLFFNGEADLNHHRIVSIVGTRKATEYGKNMVNKIVQGLKEYDVLILSGLAFGIDTASHKASLKYDVPTIGVVGHGLDIMYPAQNRNLAKKMLGNGGVLTEFNVGTQPAREHFPMRNRIIAGMSDALIVVESASRGGSIITAEYANNYNKDVFAVPGRTGDKYSEGCNKLIKSHKAALLESAVDIGYIMRWDVIDNPIPQQGTLFVELDDLEQQLIELLRENNELDVDSINHILQLQPSILATKLLSLEFKGMIKCLPGKKYMLI